MTQHFFTSDDLPNATASFVDEDASWWVGVQKSGATMALAAALALAASQAATAQQVFSFHQDDPALTAGYLDEGLWINPVGPQSWPVPQFISDDQIIVPQPVTGIADDNEIWQPLVLAYVAQMIPIPSWLSDQADIVPQPVAGTQNYINTGLNNFISQEIGEGVQF